MFRQDSRKKKHEYNLTRWMGRIGIQGRGCQAGQVHAEIWHWQGRGGRRGEKEMGVRAWHPSWAYAADSGSDHMSIRSCMHIPLAADAPAWTPTLFFSLDSDPVTLLSEVTIALYPPHHHSIKIQRT
jgi:hypothetical protein